jgi:phospholipase/carboxylesterase
VRSRIVELAGLRTIVVEPEARPLAVIVMLHGRTMAPEDLAPFAHSLGIPAAFFFPQAPYSAGINGYAWWHANCPATRAERSRARDLADVDPTDRPAARATLAACLRALPVELSEVPLLLGGFSQGAMLACDLVLSAEATAQGLILLSSSRIAFADWQPRLARVAGLPILVSHGRADRELAFAAGEALRDCLTEAGAAVTWVPFDGGHETPLVVWREVRRFFRQTVAPIRSMGPANG